jgi:hypothetical protein
MYLKMNISFNLPIRVSVILSISIKSEIPPLFFSVSFHFQKFNFSNFFYFYVVMRNKINCHSYFAEETHFTIIGWDLKYFYLMFSTFILYEILYLHCLFAYEVIKSILWTYQTDESLCMPHWSNSIFCAYWFQ